MSQPHGDEPADPGHAARRFAGASRRLSRQLEALGAKVEEERSRSARDVAAEREKFKVELEQCQASVSEQRRRLLLDRARLDVVKASEFDEVLELNVGGHLFSARRSTLCLFEGSYLANLFSGRWEHSIERDPAGRYFLDFDPVVFRSVLNALRERRITLVCGEAACCGAQQQTAPQAQRTEQFANLVEYLGLAEHLLAPSGSRHGNVEVASAAGGPAGLLRSAAELLGSLAQATGSALAGAVPNPASGSTATAGAAWGQGLQPAPRGLGHAAPTSPAEDGTVWTAHTAQPYHPRHRAGAAAAAASSFGPHGAVAPGAGCGAPPGTPLVALVGERCWSRSSTHAHPAAATDVGPCCLRIADTRALGCAAAARAACGFQAGRHSWSIVVDACSDYSYVGFVAGSWSALSCPVGRAPLSWGIASCGAAWACRHQVGRLRPYKAGSRLEFVVDASRAAVDVVIDGEDFPSAFSGFALPVYPAVSNCRSPARYTLEVPEVAETAGE